MGGQPLPAVRRMMGHEAWALVWLLAGDAVTLAATLAGLWWWLR